MTGYKLYVVDELGRQAHWPSHTDGHRGKSCLVFADSVNRAIILEHETVTTIIHISADGELEIEQED